MEERHRCKLCFRSFASGRALGGHMRSHMMKLSSPNQLQQQTPFYDSSTSSSSSEEDDDDQELTAAAMADHHFSSSVLLQDRESETDESPRNPNPNPVCRRSKRVRKSRVSDSTRFSIDAFFQAKKAKFITEDKNNTDEMETDQPLSSISDTTPEEHVAHCLIMLSRDKWTREEDDDEEEEEEEVMGKTTNKVKGKYRCETCNKCFRSYQALGGHRASHKKVKVNAPEKTNSGSPPAEEKTHQCPFCHRVFSSGQALGGHKRSHFATGRGSVIKSNGGHASSRTREILDIDLNLPAPTDDDDNSQVDVSAVSDAEFVHSVKQ